jgi:hypothetical protein
MAFAGWRRSSRVSWLVYDWRPPYHSTNVLSSEEKARAMPGGRNKGSKKMSRVVQQKIGANMDVITKAVLRGETSKAEIRAMIPAYDESMVQRIPAGKRGKVASKARAPST